MDRTVADAALNLQSIAGPRPGDDASYDGRLRARTRRASVIPPAPDTVPDYLSALDLNFVQRQAHRLQRHASTDGHAGSKIAYDALVAAGAIMVAAPRRSPSAAEPGAARRLRGSTRRSTSTTSEPRPVAPIKSLVEEVADNQANAHEALKFGNDNHAQLVAVRRHARRRERDRRTATEPAPAQGGLGTRPSTT